MSRALAVAVLAATTASAQPFVRSTVDQQPDRPLFWATRCMVYRLGAQGSAATPDRTEVPAIEAAVASWQRAAESCGNGWRFVQGEPVPVAEYHVGPEQGRPPETQLLFRDVSCVDVVPEGDPCAANPNTAHATCANKYQCIWGKDPTVIGVSLVTYLTKTGRIIDVDIEFNAAPRYVENLPAKLFTAVDGPTCTGLEEMPGTCVAFDIQNTLTHELGHAIGLDHTPDPTSTMFFSANPGETNKRKLDDGTRDGFCAVYGTQPDDVSCLGTIKQDLDIAGPVTGGCAAAPFAPLLLLALLVGRRARR